MKKIRRIAAVLLLLPALLAVLSACTGKPSDENTPSGANACGKLGGNYTAVL